MHLSTEERSLLQVLTAGDNEELCYCLKAWQALPQSVQFGSAPSKVDTLKAVAVVDRVGRALGSLSTRTSDRVAPVAAAIGKNCGIEPWAVDLFAEEVRLRPSALTQLSH
jgi:alpha-glucan, water dikinase